MVDAKLTIVKILKFMCKSHFERKNVFLILLYEGFSKENGRKKFNKILRSGEKDWLILVRDPTFQF